MPPKLVIATPEECLAHVSLPDSPERPGRLAAIKKGLDNVRLRGKPLAGGLESRKAEPADLRLAHTPAHIERIRKACARSGALDIETGVSPGSWRAALFAAGTVLAAADAVADGRARRAFCAVRPPGHHAGTDSAAGFCLFNNIALAALHLTRRRDVGRVAIVDFDAHHGNGTEEILRDDPDVLYLSLHQYGADADDAGRPYYPGTGGADVFRAASIASKAGAACRSLAASKARWSPKSSATLARSLAPAAVNCPLAPGTRWPGYERALTRRILPALDEFSPAIILLSAGFDAHRSDPLSRLELETEDFGRLTALLVRAAEKLCAGRLVSALEGGYDPSALAASVVAHVQALAAD